MEENDYFEIGREAYLNGKALKDCPEGLTAEQATEWVGGWMSAEEEFRRRRMSDQKLTIYKYPLTDEVSVLDLPKEARVLTANEQRGQICVWVLLDPEADTVPRTLRVIGTGWILPGDPGRYIATVFSGMFVWHVFEAEEEG